MNISSARVVELLQLSFADSSRWPSWPKPFHLIQGALLVKDGAPVDEVARTVRTTKARLQTIMESDDPVETALRVREADVSEPALSKLRRNIGQLVLGRAAELAFDDICHDGIDPTEYSMKDVREGRTNTDYRLLNGGGRPLYRFNVKYFGSIFRRGAEMVNLESTDCFPLATYKIYAALQKQDKEHLPYVFAIVGVPDMNAESVAAAISEDEVLPVALLSTSPVVTRKRDFEDWLVDRIVTARSPAFATAYQRIRDAEWYVLSARRAHNLLHDMLYERVYALRVPGFTRQFGRAEVDMHFSLSKDLVTLTEFLRTLRDHGQGKVTSMLERGTY